MEEKIYKETMTYSDEVIKVCNKVHELVGRCDRLESEVAWLREAIIGLISRTSYPPPMYPTIPWYTPPTGPTSTGTGLTVGENVVPLKVGPTTGER